MGAEGGLFDVLFGSRNVNVHYMLYMAHLHYAHGGSYNLIIFFFL